VYVKKKIKGGGRDREVEEGEGRGIDKRKVEKVSWHSRTSPCSNQKI
jgi:hypothetical protein